MFDQWGRLSEEWKIGGYECVMDGKGRSFFGDA